MKLSELLAIMFIIAFIGSCFTIHSFKVEKDLALIERDAALKLQDEVIAKFVDYQNKSEAQHKHLMNNIYEDADMFKVLNHFMSNGATFELKGKQYIYSTQWQTWNYNTELDKTNYFTNTIPANILGTNKQIKLQIK